LGLGGSIDVAMHSAASDCLTGDAAYDAHTRLNLQWGTTPANFPRVEKRAGVHTLTVICAVRRHLLGQVHSVSEGLLLLARYDSAGRNDPSYFDGAAQLRTIRVEYVAPTLLDERDEVATTMAMRCPCGLLVLDAQTRQGLEGAAVAAQKGSRLPVSHLCVVS
jgi:hypothetical protein